MKKWTALLLVVLLLISLIACAQEAQSEKPYRLKTQTIDRYLAGERTSRWEYDYTYNEVGYISQITYSLDGEIVETDIYETDEYGNVIRVILKPSDGTMNTEDKILTLDAQHRILREENYWNGVLDRITEMAYDRNGNQTQLTNIRIQEGLENNIVWEDYVYDSSGNLVEEVRRWNNGVGGITKDNTNNLSTTQYEYQDGRCIRSETLGNRGKMVSFGEHRYDETGLVQTCQRYKADGSEYGKTVNIYDEYSNLLVCEKYGAWDPVTQCQDELPEQITTYTYERISP